MLSKLKPNRSTNKISDGRQLLHDVTSTAGESALMSSVYPEQCAQDEAPT